MMLWLVLSIRSLLAADCSGGSPSTIATVNLWSRSEPKNFYRLSDEDLSVQGFHLERASHVGLLRESSGCEEDCLIRLSLSRDGDSLEVEGESSGEHFLCSHRYLDCAATVPIYRATRTEGGRNYYTYMFDNTTRIEGYTREENPVCFGWTTHDTRICPDLLVKRGKVSYSGEKTRTGSTATLVCDPGLAITGEALLLCTTEGWLPKQFGSCSDVTSSSYCNVFTAPRGTSVIYSSSTVNGTVPPTTVASTLCQLGFVSTGIASRCSSGRWEPDILGCFPLGTVRCSPHTAVLNGNLEYTWEGESPFTIGARIVLRCDEGYRPAGAETTTCTSNGWSRTLGPCSLPSAIQCPLLPNARGGRISYSLPFTPTASGSTALLTCDEEGLTGAATAVCLNGQWTNRLGRCMTAEGDPRCLPRAFVVNGAVSYTTALSENGHYVEGTVSTITCSDGYYLTGERTGVCEKGKWNPTNIGNCGTLPPTSCQDPIVAQGTVVGSNGRWMSGTEAQFTCPGQATTTIISCVNGTWTPPLSTLSCTTKQACPALPSPLFGSLEYSAGTPPYPTGTMVKLTCTNGEVAGATLAECVNGIWSEPLAVCPEALSNMANPGQFIGPGGVVQGANVGQGRGFEVPGGDSRWLGGPRSVNSASTLCSPFQYEATYSRPLNGNIYEVGTSAMVTCPVEGIPGPNMATCTVEGWQPLNICGNADLEAACPGGRNCRLQAIARTGGECSIGPTGLPNLGGSYPNGATLVLQCPLGSSAIGSTTAICNNGQWTTIGSCLSAGPSSQVGQLNQVLSNCLDAPMVLNGNIMYSSPMKESGSMAYARCLNGFALTGSTQLFCDNGRWTPPQFGECRMSSQCLVAPITPLRGNLQFSTNTLLGPWPEGTTLVLVCDPSSDAIGPTTAKCIGGQFSPPIGTCQSLPSKLPCFPPLTPLNGQLNYSAPTLPSGQLSDGTMAALLCSNGAAARGVTLSTCKNGAWNPPIGVCGITKRSIANCETPRAPGGGEITFSLEAVPGTGTTYPEGTEAVLRCVTGTVYGAREARCFRGVFVPLLGRCFS